MLKYINVNLHFVCRVNRLARFFTNKAPLEFQKNLASLFIRVNIKLLELPLVSFGKTNTYTMYLMFVVAEQIIGNKYLEDTNILRFVTYLSFNV